MKRIASLLVLFLLAGNSSVIFAQTIKQPVKQSQQATYKNPLPVAFGDPYVFM
jgi:hypothetical protein